MKKIIADFFTGWKCVLQSFRDFREDELRKPVLRFVWGDYAWAKLIGLVVVAAVLIIALQLAVYKMLSPTQLDSRWGRYLLMSLGTLADITILLGLFVGWSHRTFMQSVFYRLQLRMIPGLANRLFAIFYSPLIFVPLFLFAANYLPRIYVWLTNDELREMIGFWNLFFGIQLHGAGRLALVENVFLKNSLEILQGLIAPFVILGLNYSKFLLVVLLVSMSRTGRRALLSALAVAIGFLVYDRLTVYLFSFVINSNGPPGSHLLGYARFFISQTPFLFLPGFIWVFFRRRFISCFGSDELT